MLRICIIGMLLLPIPVSAQLTPEQLLDNLLDVPWTMSPENLPSVESYAIEPFTRSNTFELQGYNLRAFYIDNRDLRMKVFTYAEPSLTDSQEIMLMGYVQGTAPTEAEADILHEKLETLLKSMGFVSNPSDSLAQELSRFNITYFDVVPLKRDDLNGMVYVLNRNNRWIVRAMVSHPRFQEFSNKRMTDWPKWWTSNTIIPDNLVMELEEKNVSQIISSELWNKIKDISSHDRDYYWDTDHLIPVSDLATAYDNISVKNFSTVDIPTFMLFRNYLVRYLFISVYMRAMSQDQTQLNAFTQEQKQWLEGHGLTYVFSRLGNENIYEENLLWNLWADYPNTYWGQYAFYELLIRGFDTSGVCRGGQDQWSRVLSEGMEFIETYPDSPLVPDIQFFLGKAAETQFNLGIEINYPARETSGMSIDQFAPHVEEACKQAIAFYEEVLQSSQNAAYVNNLWYILPRLRGRFGTGTIYYYCFYD